jgi:hypothetical protein
MTSLPVSRRKTAIGLWITTMSLLIAFLLLTTLSIFYLPEALDSIRLADSTVVPIAFILLLIGLYLNGWKPFLKK